MIEIGAIVPINYPYSIIAGRVYSVQKYPLLWLKGIYVGLKKYFENFKGNTFFVPTNKQNVYYGNPQRYAEVTTIDLADQNLETDLSFLDKFPSLNTLKIEGNNYDLPTVKGILQHLININYSNGFISINPIQTYLFLNSNNPVADTNQGIVINEVSLTGNFTISFNYYLIDANSYYYILANTNGLSNIIIVKNFIVLRGNSTTGTNNIPINPVLVANTNYFIEIIRVNTTITVKINNIVIGSFTDSSTYVFNAILKKRGTAQPTIYANKNAISNLRISNNTNNFFWGIQERYGNIVYEQNNLNNGTITDSNNNVIANPNRNAIAFSELNLVISNLQAKGNTIVTPKTYL